MIWLAVVFALASAATTALSTSTQHLATGKAPDASGVLDLMRFLARRPEWLLALCLGPVGFTFHVLALDNGPIALVQPIAIMGIVFAVPIRAALARTWPSRDELVAVAVTALAIAALLLATDVQQAGHSPAPLLMVAACAASAFVALVALAAAGAVRGATARAFLLGCASGVLFGMMAVLIEACQLRYDDHGLVGLATSWLPYALVASGLGGISVNQLAYRSARLSASMPVLNVVNCLLTLAFAHVVFREVPDRTAGSATVSVLAIAGMAWGLWRLAGLELDGPSAHVAVADDDVLGGGHLGQAHRAAGVQLLGADPDLGAEAELSAVGEPRGRVDQDGC